MPLVQLHGLTTVDTAKCDDAPLHQLLDCGPINAIISIFPAAKTFANLPPEELGSWALNHNTLLSAYCRHATVLPIALGAVFSSKAAVKAQVRMKSADHLAALKTLVGIKEFTLRLSTTTAAPLSTSPHESGRDFLKARRQRRDQRRDLSNQRQQLARRILDQLEDIAIQIQPAATPRADRLIDCVALMNKRNIDSIQDIARDVGAQQSALGLTLEVTGPWPPYSFDTSALPALCNAS